jgi:hypothetical protein
MRSVSKHRSKLLPFVSSALCLSAAAFASAAPWPGGPETSIPISGASTDLSGATWNPHSQSLWIVRQSGQVWEYAYDAGAPGYVLVRTVVLPIGIGTDIESCAQVDRAAVDELYTLAEDHGRIARVSDVDGTPTVTRVWNLQVTNNGNALPAESLAGLGAEALEFVPDAQLLAAGFRFPNGSAFSGSTKGMGGLMFVGHQIDGRLHVFDLNPATSNDFVNHGSFLTGANEIAGLAYDRASGQMLIWHNPNNVNSLEVSKLSSNGTVGRLDTLALFDAAMPPGNLEGIAVVERSSCGELGADDASRALFFTRDSESPNLVFFDGLPCDCTGAENAAEFDACAARGDLGGGCICLDQDQDGDVDCDDFEPEISSQCVSTPVPALGGLARVGIVALLLLVVVSASRLRT